MRIAAAQMACVVGDVAANMAKAGKFIAQAKEKGAETILFPEMIDTGYDMDSIRRAATSWDEGAVVELRRLARDQALSIVAGVSERRDDKIFNAQIFIDRSGEIAGSYRKMHLFRPAPIEEDKCFTAGSSFFVHEAGGLRLGASICYDLRFPEVYRSLALDHQANAFLISSAWPFPRVEHFRTLAVARAIENQSYVVSANRVGTDGQGTFCGSSAIVDPYGVTLAAASTDREELIYAELDGAVVDSVRKRMPVFRDRREELYRA